ncbi:MAG: GspE/PulE family protein [Beijerinckiaceae bacterium]|nr:GspE/PulE family protein [Beijerinckiaceae bacterium]MCZ8298993.1 GspE/PulE family protein [Beijerinckiaceae bacterium]
MDSILEAREPLQLWNNAPLGAGHAAGIAIAENLAAQNLITASQLERGRRAAQASGDRLDIVLNKLGLVSDSDLLKAYRAATGFSILSAEALEHVGFCPKDVDPGFFRHTKILPLREHDGILDIAVADPLDLRSVQALRFRLGIVLNIGIMARTELEAALGRLTAPVSVSSEELASASHDEGADDIERLRDIASEAPIIRLVTETIETAVQQAASDIHITRGAEGGRIRFRLDGRLIDVRQLSPRVHQAVVSRLKIMAALDIGERRLPQDGRIRIAARGREIDLRISTMPHAHGEGAFIRVLDNKSAVLDLEGLGFSQTHSERIRGILTHAHGLFLITGPTGSGKTTTLYAALRHLNDPSKNIVTVEDPIEYSLPGINQIQVNRRAGLDFSRTLRSVLRQDPDIIMIGEIRDRETAAIAVQAALTGHLVLATLHTNDALSAIDRLIDMEVEPFLLASVLRGVMAQRLVRKSCPHCRARRNRIAQLSGETPRSCRECHDTGFSGRMPLAEVVPVGAEIQEAVSSRKGTRDIAAIALALGYETLQTEGDRLVDAGLTIRAEIFRALGE